MNATPEIFNFDNTFAREMEGFYAAIAAEKAPDPKLLLLNTQLAEELGADVDILRSKQGVDALAGNLIPNGATPIGQAYAGHQFGGFSPSLGDGRALLLGEVIDRDGNRRDIQLKGSGRTPFSRNGDGKAALGPVLREYLISEAMHALGIATTRSLAAVTTGSKVFREKPLPGAVLTRVASSHIRVGTFQFFAARNQTDKVARLADYVIARHDPDLAGKPDRYLDFLDHVIERQAKLIADWMSVGFIHGVMNTDNMSIAGETIDYGPCAFMDIYNPDTVFSSIDEFGRYAYRMQPIIGQWNLARLAECLLVLIIPNDPEEAARIATNLIETFPSRYEACWLANMRSKLGFGEVRDNDLELVNEFHDLISKGNADFTRSFRSLSNVTTNDNAEFFSLFSDDCNPQQWLERWRKRLDEEALSEADRIAMMDSSNPVYIPRNHLIEEALSAAVDHDDLQPVQDLAVLFSEPYKRQSGQESREMEAPENFGPHVTYCGT